MELPDQVQKGKSRTLPSAALTPNASQNVRVVGSNQTVEQIGLIASVQEELAKNREQLLVRRQVVSNSAKKVKIKRLQMGDAEVALMNILREYVHTAENLPSNLWAAYTAVESFRNDLGALEDDHLSKERDLTGAEVKFTQRENDFYQFELYEVLTPQHLHPYPPPPPPPPPPPLPPPPSLPPSLVPLHSHSLPPGVRFSEGYNHVMTPPPPPPPPQLPPQLRSFPSRLEIPRRTEQLRVPVNTERGYAIVSAELSDLRQQFDRLRREEAVRFTTEDLWHVRRDTGGVQEPGASGFPEASSAVIQRMIDCEAELLRLKTSNNSQTSSSESASTNKPIQQSLAYLTLSASSELHETPARGRVQSWLLDYLKDNVVQKTLYLNILRRYGFHDFREEAYHDLASEYWSVDNASERAMDGFDERLAIPDSP